MISTKERFHTFYCSIFETQNRLVLQLKLAVSEGAFQVSLQLAASLHPLIHFRLKVAIGSSTCIFCLIKRYISGFHQRIEIVGIIWCDGDANADIDDDLMVFDTKRCMNRIAHPHRQIGGIRRPLEQNLRYGKFIAAQSGDQIYISGTISQPLGNANEQFIADRMTEGVVDTLQMVDIEIQERQLFAAMGAFEYLFKLLAKQSSIWKSRQWIMVRNVIYSLFGPFRLGDVLVGSDPSATGDGMVHNGNDTPIG